VKDWNSSLSEAMQLMVSDQPQGIDSVVSCNQDIKSILALNKMTRQLGIKFVALRMHGNCGFLFNDCLEEFIVEDIDGEIDKEVHTGTHLFYFFPDSAFFSSLQIPLKSSFLFTETESDANSSLSIQVESIEEENLNYGLSDKIEIKSTGNHHYHHSKGYTGTVTKVTSMKFLWFCYFYANFLLILLPFSCRSTL
jgi:hypothetical protein